MNLSASGKQWKKPTFGRLQQSCDVILQAVAPVESHLIGHRGKQLAWLCQNKINKITLWVCSVQKPKLQNGMLWVYKRGNSFISYGFPLFSDFMLSKTNELLAVASHLRIRQKTGIFSATAALSKKGSESISKNYFFKGHNWNWYHIIINSTRVPSLWTWTAAGESVSLWPRKDM